MSRMNAEDVKTRELWIETAMKAGNASIAISGALTIPAKAPFILTIDPTGAQSVTLPTKGSRFIHIMIHGSTNNADLTIKDSTGTTIGTLSQNEMGWAVDNGTVTRFVTGLTT